MILSIEEARDILRLDGPDNDSIIRHRDLYLIFVPIKVKV